MKTEYPFTLPRPQELAKIPHWRASWAEADPQNALVHHYFFAAEDAEEAQEKVFAWMRKPARPLPDNTRIFYEYWRLPTNVAYGLLIWRINWQEAGEKHSLLLFEPSEQDGAALRAQLWAHQRNETLEQFQRLERLHSEEISQAWFDPTHGQAMFAL